MSARKLWRIYWKGYRLEWEVKKALEKNGYYVVRVPHSGNTKKDNPYFDIIAIKQGKILIIETKLRRDGRPIFLDTETVKKIRELEERLGAMFFLCAKMGGVGKILCLRVEDAGEKRPDKYRFDKNDFINKGVEVERL